MFENKTTADLTDWVCERAKKKKKTKKHAQFRCIFKKIKIFFFTEYAVNILNYPLNLLIGFYFQLLIA